MANDTELLAIVDAGMAREVAFLQELVRLPSDNPPGDCAAAGEATAILLEDLGFSVERHVVPEDVCAAHGMRSAVNLIVRERYGDGPVVALNAHGDVVPPGEGWSIDPYGGEIRDDTMYGRGVAVSKSDIATYAFAMLALRQAAPGLAGSIELHVTYDEETGGFVGPKWLLEQGISSPDMVLCASFCHAIVTAHNGCLHLEVTVTGQSAHAADPASGIDALEAANAILTSLYAHRRELPQRRSSRPGIGHPNLVVGLIEGGINTNVVPDTTVFRLDRRIVPEEDSAAVEEELRALIAEAALPFTGASVEVRRIMLARPLAPVDGVERLVTALQSATRTVAGEDIEETGVPLYTDARHYAERGIPTALFGAGPESFLEANAHRADERLRLSDLERATKVAALALRDILSA